MLKRQQKEHRLQWPSGLIDPTQHAEGRTGDFPGPHNETPTRRNVTQRVGGGLGDDAKGHAASSRPTYGGLLLVWGLEVTVWTIFPHLPCLRRLHCSPHLCNPHPPPCPFAPVLYLCPLMMHCRWVRLPSSSSVPALAAAVSVRLLLQENQGQRPKKVWAYTGLKFPAPLINFIFCRRKTFQILLPMGKTPRKGREHSLSIT